VEKKKPVGVTVVSVVGGEVVEEPGTVKSLKKKDTPAAGEMPRLMAVDAIKEGVTSGPLKFPKEWVDADVESGSLRAYPVSVRSESARLGKRLLAVPADKVAPYMEERADDWRFLQQAGVISLMEFLSSAEARYGPGEDVRRLALYHNARIMAKKAVLGEDPRDHTRDIQGNLYISPEMRRLIEAGLAEALGPPEEETPPVLTFKPRKKGPKKSLLEVFRDATQSKDIPSPQEGDEQPFRLVRPPAGEEGIPSREGAPAEPPQLGVFRETPAEPAKKPRKEETNPELAADIEALRGLLRQAGEKTAGVVAKVEIGKLEKKHRGTTREEIRERLKKELGEGSSLWRRIQPDLEDE